MTAITPSDIYVSTQGIRLHVRDWGGAGRPIVLLHGLASNARIWDFVAPLLADVARVVAIDQRGHGASDRPDDGYGWDSVTADLAGALDGLAIGAPLIVGHSWGGNVAVAFAAAHPGRVSGLALIDGGWSDLSQDDGMTWEKAERMLMPPRLAGMPRRKLLDAVQSGELGAVWSPAMEAMFMAQFDVSPDDTIAPVLSFEKHMKIVRAIWEYRPFELLPRVTAPVLLVPAGKSGADWVARKRTAAETVERLLPTARTVWFEDSIHDIPLQHPEKLASVLSEFASGLGTP